MPSLRRPRVIHVLHVERAMFALSFSHQEPLVIPWGNDVEARLAAMRTVWRQWSDGLRPVSAWPGAVSRSALALKLLVHAPSGAIAAAATTSLPEVVGGERNWDYRFCSVRDSAFMLNALLRLGCVEEADAFFWWLMQASALTHRGFGCSTGWTAVPAVESARPGSPAIEPRAPFGSGTAGQLQLDVYGDLLYAAWLYAEAGR
jgi:GH15 family glucan-1,4-alpha-glucosidase